MNKNICLSNQKIEELERRVYQSKILLNMIIHDMRAHPDFKHQNFLIGLEQVNLRLMENKKMRN